MSIIGARTNIINQILCTFLVYGKQFALIFHHI